jgi:glycolate oxidase
MDRTSSGEADSVMPRAVTVDDSAAVERVADRLRPRFAADALITDLERRRTYECDGLAHYRSIPALVVLPADAGQVAEAVRACVAENVPYVARGAGTGLSGGALPHPSGVLIVTSRMRTIHEIDAANHAAVVDPAVTNAAVSAAAGPVGFYYAPDPSSQQVCSIGGNVAENAGGAHCLKYGFTAHHVTGLDIVTPDGEAVSLGGGKSLDPPGYDLLGAFIGSEGTLGIATRVTLRLLRRPEAVRTLLAGFAGTDDAGAAVSAIIAAGVVPAAIEMMDALAIEAAEAAVACGYPAGAGAVLVIEVDGPAGEVDESFAAVERICRDNAAIEIRVARDETERGLFWRGRKSAFAAVGRISPDYIVQDGVIPRAALPTVLRRIAELSAAAGIRVANVFHAGDGNLHPLVLFDEKIPGQAERAERVSGQILELCVAEGGSITGEHGVGAEKAAFMPVMFTAADLDAMQMVRCAFDPAGLCNPGKIFPTPRLCGEPPGRRRGAHPLQESGLAELF